MELESPEFLKKVEALNRVIRKIFSGERHGEAPMGLRGQGSLFRDFRPYAGGDDLRYVDWNIFARLDTLVVKQFEEEENPEVFLLLDVSPSMDFGSPHKLDYAKLVAASIGSLVLSNLGTLHVAATPSEVEKDIRAYRGAGQSIGFFKYLGQLGVSAATDPFVQAVDLLSLQKRLTGVVILSDFYDVESLTRMLAFLRHRMARVSCVHVLSREEMEPQDVGSVVVDAETGGGIPVELDRTTLTAYRRAFRRHCVRVEAECKRNEVLYTRVDTTTPFERTVLNLFDANRARR